MSVQINGTTYTYLMQPNRDDALQSQALSGGTATNRWALHTIKTNIMPMTEFNNLFALQGQAVTLYTTDYSSRNSYRTYYKAVLESVTGSHESINAANVVATFRVRL